MFAYLGAVVGSFGGLSLALYLGDGQFEDALEIVNGCMIIVIGAIAGTTAGGAIDDFLEDWEESKKAI